MEDLVLRKNIIDRAHFNNIQGAASGVLLKFCRHVFDKALDFCREILEWSAFELERGEKEILDEFLELHELLGVARGKRAKMVLSKAIEDGKSEIDVCKKVVERVNSIRSKVGHIVINDERHKRVLQACGGHL
jgi:hypothetical protein